VVFGLAGLLAAGVACAALAAVLLGGPMGGGSPALPTPAAATPALIAQGAYLADVGDCASCHTAKGAPTFTGGSPIQSPVGVIYSPNITPDAKTGIGAYTVNDFARVLRQGVLPNGQSIYPAMPYPSFSRLTDADVEALYAYFQHGVAPVSRENRPEGIMWPLSMRWPLTYWRWLFAPAARPFVPVKNESPAVSRGAYLVEGLGHCGACHTSRALTLQERALEPDRASRYLAGSRFNGWYAPSLRGDDVAGLGLWTDADIRDFLKSGRSGGVAAFGEMGEVVSHSTHDMTDGDLAAIASFLRTLPAPPHAQRLPRPAPPTGVLAAGEAAYSQNCAACHQPNGQGVPQGFPALAHNPVVNAHDPTSLIHLVLKGGAIPKTTKSATPLIMPPFASSLSDQEAADILSYVRNAWGNRAPALSAGAVKSLRAALKAPEPPPPAPPSKTPSAAAPSPSSG